MEIRKIVKIVEEVHREMGKPVKPPTRRAAAIAVITNPFAGRYEENLDQLINVGEELGGLLGRIAVEALGILPEQVESYGKGAIVGPRGEWSMPRRFSTPSWAGLSEKQWAGARLSFRPQRKSAALVLK